MPEFKREERYIVVKLKRIDDDQIEAVREVLESYQIPTEQSVVVEHDWPIYEQTWDAVQRLAEGRPQEAEEERALLRECRAALDDLIDKKPGIEALEYGSTTLGNLRAELGKYRRGKQSPLQDLYMKLREQSDLSVARIHRLEEALRIMLMEPWDRTAGQADEARAMLKESPAVSLATVKAGAIEKATEEVQARQEALFGRLGSPSEAQREGIGSTLLDFRMYAAEIRQSANQPEK